MRKHGYTQQETADAIGVAQRTVGVWGSISNGKNANANNTDDGDSRELTLFSENEKPDYRVTLKTKDKARKSAALQMRQTRVYAAVIGVARKVSTNALQGMNLGIATFRIVYYTLCARSCDMTETELPRLYTYSEVAEMVGLAEITIRKAVSRGQLACTQVGPRTIRFTAQQIRDYLTEKPARGKSAGA